MFGNNYRGNTPPDLTSYFPQRRFLKWGVIVIGGLALFLWLKPFVIIPAGHVGVVVTLGKVQEGHLAEGFNLVNPISNIKVLDVRVEKAVLKDSNASTKDLQIVHSDLTVNYRIGAAHASSLVKEVGATGYEDKVLLPAINESFKAVTAKFTSEELITKRDIVSSQILDELKTKVDKWGITINDVSITNFQFSKEYTQAIESKVIATQRSLQAEQDLARIKIEAEQKIAQAKGDAEAIRIQAQAIQSQGGKDYTTLKLIEKWNGELPTYVGGGNPFSTLSINGGK